MNVKVWLKAFIPNDYEFAEPVKGAGPHAGKMMMHFPLPIKSSFLTDERGFSSDIDAKARMHSEIEIDIANGRVLHEKQWCYETIEVDPNTGEERCKEHGSTDRMRFHNFRMSGRVISIDLEASSSNPCVKLASIPLSPRQDYNGTLTLFPSENSVTIVFDGKIEPFPAFEMYASVNGSTPQPLFQLREVKGSTPVDLIGDPERDVYAAVEVPIRTQIPTTP